MATASTVLRVDNLPVRQVSALKRKAEKLGLAPADYVRQLIEDDLAMDRTARTSSLDKLAAPFRKAFRGLGEDELDRMVNAARAQRTCPPRTRR